MVLFKSEEEIQNVVRGAFSGVPSNEQPADSLSTRDLRVPPNSGGQHGRRFRADILSRLAEPRVVRKYYKGALSVQSGGGYATRQNLGTGRVNSTAILVSPLGSVVMDTTRHSFCSPVLVFCTQSNCLRATNSRRGISAPCALTVSVCVVS